MRLMIQQNRKPPTIGHCPSVRIHSCRLSVCLSAALCDFRPLLRFDLPPTVFPQIVTY